MLHLHIHPENPQARLITQAVERIRAGDVVIYPTDAAYAIGCQIGNKNAMERIAQIRGLGPKHQYAIMCCDLSDIATYAKVDNAMYRLLKNNTPAVTTFILPATSEVPKRLMHPKKKTIGLRIPSNPVAQALLKELGEPLLTSTLILPDQKDPLDDPYDIENQLGKRIDVFIDSGFGTLSTTSIVDLSGENPEIVRRGVGDVSAFE
ncbi:L-threonylcarbamoyladenylate synthase [Acinetobacter vivianii]|jgi:tRNA threonylcarbamoyl adenosine modification protein (Sua5/YciO/YrdC/YwlC family)|uniref:L-threonylcarbamoyladenylate synthase n=2 Tax=Acinetobacter TaxID=469 RepID=N9MFI8_9GAMM|nr:MULTISPECIES: L-threonylcarbamoyladenylate synthase [Acinetobacter]EXB25801.1 tRNA threonylcarbamoyl adenosine modification protein, Sua5/YciO/YrdC/YwlC family [Acinetobacter baumannii 1437282]EXB49540.1 tRNA threonylcarbamoyl adenosine modification protein, Sua5/YciO/YrdC/YwlC family [Acinetobacter baumannii 146457]RSN80481.1 threonylcarbamoyl-AMP synthase [Acinetobacter baumannii]ENU92642.1 Sua5/YciO/YrdC/YwlC family protein [Acinetobacter vivianii]ENX07303.1 Sua5/YciO/YrdC/YwlC family pr